MEKCFSGVVTTGLSVPSGPVPAVRVCEARPADREAFLSLVALASPGEPLATNLGDVLTFSPGRLSHGASLCLVARDAGQRPVGALLGGVPRWVYEHELCAGTVLPHLLAARVASIHAVAVYPGFHGQGIGRKLIRGAERRFRQAGFRLATLEHRPGLTGFYRKHGYTSHETLIIKVPGEDLLGQLSQGLLTAAKPLCEPVRMVEVPGAPARIVSEILPDCGVPANARFAQGRLMW